MDKSWMQISDRKFVKYLNGIEQFLNFTSQHEQWDGTIICPCKKCVHSTMLDIDVVQTHLVSYWIC